MAKAIISTTYNNTYLYFLPIVTFCWHKLNVGTICFMPFLKDGVDGYNPDKEKREKYSLIIDTLDKLGVELQTAPFSAPEHKEATYAQCSRLYGACLDLPEDEVLITGDVDMAVFNEPGTLIFGNIYGMEHITIVGNDLTPEKQYPMCYCAATVSGWRKFMNLEDKTYQQCLDELLGNEECENMRGNFWSKDQEILFNKINKYKENNRASIQLQPRAREGTQFASKRYDRDDAFLLDRLSPDTIDFHMPRPGYEPQNFDIILKVLQYHYPNDKFDWLIEYTNAYKQLL